MISSSCLKEAASFLGPDSFPWPPCYCTQVVLCDSRSGYLELNSVAWAPGHLMFFCHQMSQFFPLEHTNKLITILWGSVFTLRQEQIRPHHLEGGQRVHWYLFCLYTFFLDHDDSEVYHKNHNQNRHRFVYYAIIFKVSSNSLFYKNMLTFVKDLTVIINPAFHLSPEAPGSGWPKVIGASQVACGRWPTGRRESHCYSAWSMLYLCRTDSLDAKKR